jgi:ABC-type Fe3+/spermidine/putrescine transport system ATPase subunit
MASEAPDFILQLDDIRVTFGPQTVLDGCDLQVTAGEFVTLLGPSGCGKSTSLNIIAGFLRPDSGTVRLRGQVANDLAPRRRNLGMVFQSWALFPHMSVFDNVAFGLRTRRVKRTEITTRVEAMLELVKLSGASTKYPSQLSGGMQQRVALARALVTNPSVLLLDEPLSNLDAALRKEMQVHIKHIHEQLKVTTVLVTHSQEEALVMSDRIAVMRNGRIERIADPVSIYNDPGTTFVARFLGDTNLIEGVVRNVAGDMVTVDAHGWRFDVMRAGASASYSQGDKVVVSVRPEQLTLGAEGGSPGAANGSVEAVVDETIYMGSHVTYFLRVGERTLIAESLSARAGRDLFDRGARLSIRFDPSVAAFVTKSEGEV